MKRHASWKERLQYSIDNLFARGTGTLIAALGVASIAVIALAALVIIVVDIRPMGGEAKLGFIEAFWLSLVRTLDPGTMGADQGWGFRIVMLLVTMGGIFIISTLIGVLSSGIEAKLEDLRKGRSTIVENNHTVILGWSEQVFSVIEELVAANKNQPNSCLVLMGSHDKVDMDDQIKEKVSNTGRTKVVCRTGNPIEMADLRIVSLNTARSIIVLSPDDSEDPDSEVIKTCLAIINFPGRKADPFHVVAEIHNPKNFEVAQVVGRGEVEWVLVGDLVARVIAQTCRQSGLSVVYNELLDFGGDEIYFYHNPVLVGKTYGESLSMFNKNAVMGILPTGGNTSLNPPMDTVIQPGDQIFLMAADDDKILLDAPGQVYLNAAIIVSDNQIPLSTEKTLVLGWNWRCPAILREMNNYVAPGSELLLVADSDDAESEISHCFGELRNETITFQRGDTTDRKVLDSLGLDSFSHIILLCYSDELSPQQADARTLVTLLHLRDIADRNRYTFSIVSEMLDVRNRNLAAVTRADDFIVSNRLVSLMMAQVSENKKLNSVFADIFDPEGSELYLKPIGSYIQPGQAVNFYTLIEAARRRGETAIGYHLKAHAQDAEKMYGVVLNPSKNEKVTFAPDDRLIVISES